MSYEPTVWKTGDVVTSAKLNKLEQGVAGGGGGGTVDVFVVHVVPDPDSSTPFGVMTAETAGELEEALLNHKAFIVLQEDSGEGYASANTYTCTFQKDEGDDHLYGLSYSVGPMSVVLVADNSNDNLKVAGDE